MDGVVVLRRWVWCQICILTTPHYTDVHVVLWHRYYTNCWYP